MKRFLIISVLCSLIRYSTANCLPLPKNVTFKSVNFEHIVHWEASAGDTAYSVQYKKYGESEWLLKSDCQNITNTFCNLTLELDWTEQYNARVAAVSKNCTSRWVDSKRFSPKRTAFGRPTLSYVAGVRSIKFVIQPPYIPLRSKDGYQETVESIYNYDILYHLIISNLKTSKQWRMTKKEKEIDVVSLDPDTEYNGIVFFSIRKSAENSEEQAFLVRTLPDSTWLQLLLVGLAFSFGLLVLTLCCVCHKYVQHPRQQPKSLDFKGMTPFQPMTPSKEDTRNSSINVFSWPGGLPSAAPFPGIGTHAANKTESSQPLAPSGNAYRLQTIYSQSLSKSSPPKDQSPFTSCSQFKQKYTPDGSSKKLPLTYGVYAQVTSPGSHSIYQLDQERANTPTDGISLAEVNAPQYQCQTQLAPDESSESHPSMKATGLDVLSYPHQCPRETRFPFNSNKLTLQIDRDNDEKDIPLLLSVLEVGVGSNNYRPHPAGLLSLLSTVQVQEDCLSDHGLDEQPPSPSLHAVTGTHGELIEGAQCVFVDSLTQTENTMRPFQYRTQDLQNATEQLWGEQSHPQYSYKPNNSLNAELFFRNVYDRLHEEQR
ncbi:interleukin-22 receptor subunit alpha-1 [Microcaecilia unicolor]|uniref:Interleukin-22 receptor subunit alpha-1 n=1 Tax=Microcaecilia unicolor TaxID=1415580 RepID=A0A6P7ZAR3_9AMPH|nr:interleukin-22 receptor subunit alpha-1 [Microcaecilia unicolor]